MNRKCSLWVEKWRPVRVKDVVMPSAFHKYFANIIETGNVPNLLLYSSTPGTGKTTIAKALANDLGVIPLYINASEEGGIDTLRNQIKEFAQTKSFDKKTKIVILDEFDGTSPQFQGALRAFLEEFANSCRFILTANYITKVIPALQEGRTVVWDFNMSKKEYREELNELIFTRICGILKYENVKFDEDVIRQLITAYSPSMRKLLATLQKYSETYDKIDEGIIQFRNIGTELSDLLKAHKVTEARNYCNSNGYSPQDIYKNIFDNLIPQLTKNKSQAIITLADYSYRTDLCSQPDLQVAACFIEMISFL